MLDAQISLRDWVRPAWTYTCDVLFRPVRPLTWISFAVLITAGQAVQGNTGFDYDLEHFSMEHPLVTTPFMGTFFQETGLAILHNLPFIGLAFVALCAGILLGSYAELMLIRALTSPERNWIRLWRETAKYAHSLFIVRFLLSFIGLVSLFTLLVVSTLRALSSEAPVAVWEDLFSMPVIVVSVIITVLFFLVNSVLHVYVAPVMLQMDMSCVDASQTLYPAARKQLRPLLVLLVVRVGYIGASLALGALLFGMGSSPGLHHLLFAPLYVFDQVLALMVLGALGPEFRLLEDW